jgi:hypothetical protein
MTRSVRVTPWGCISVVWCFFAAPHKKSTTQPIVSGDATSAALVASRAYLKCALQGLSMVS